MSISITKPIIICGGGISGLAFAQGLLKHNLPFRIFERDPALNIRSQGYRVRINGLGIDALKSVLTQDLFARLEDSCAHATGKDKGPPVHLDALTAEPREFKFGANPPGGPQRPGADGIVPLNADRSVLRSVLMRGLEKFVVFGKTFESFEVLAEKQGVKVRFEDGEEVYGSLLVGADGSHSRVKKQLLPQHIYVDTEARWFYGKTILTPELMAVLNERAGQRLTLVQDKTKEVPLSLLLEPVRFKDTPFRDELPEDYIYWVLGSRKDHFAMPDDKLLRLSSEEAARETQRLTAHWHPSFHPLFAMQDISKTSILKIDSARPEIPVWKTNPVVTLIGDAVHAMSPTAGVGAVSALRGAAMLAGLLGDNGAGVESLSEYEDEMRVLASEAIKMSYFGGKMLFGMRDFSELKDNAS